MEKSKNNQFKKIKTKQCEKCEGYGMVKQETIKCDLCNGIKCIMCKETGFAQLPYETCETCDGAGCVEINN
jgi:hypothetical protein